MLPCSTFKPANPATIETALINLDQMLNVFSSNRSTEPQGFDPGLSLCKKVLCYRDPVRREIDSPESMRHCSKPQYQCRQMISYKYRTIFIHIPKCAGTSIERALGYYDLYDGRNRQDHRTISEIKPNSFGAFHELKSIINYNRKIFLNKIGRKYKSNPKNTLQLDSKKFDDFFKFTFVRNPWDRAVSWYRNVLRDPAHQRKLAVSSDISFEVFLRQYCNTGQLRSQLHWLKDEKGSIEFDYVGRFESLHQDFDRICSLIGAEGVSLPHEMNGGTAKYRDYYDEDLKNFIAEQYAEEIELFGYKY